MTDRRGEARMLRARLAALEARADALGERAASGVPRMLAQVYSAGSLPTANGKFFACHPATVSGTEGENQVPGISADSSQTIYVDVLGTKVPAVGDVLVCRRVDRRWVAWRGIHASTPSNSCGNFPDIPSTLNLTSPATGLSFANDGSLAAVSETLTYGAPPAAISAAMPSDNCAGGTTITLPTSWYSPSRAWAGIPGDTYYIRFHIASCTAILSFIHVASGGGPADSGQGFNYRMNIAFAGGHLPLTSFWSRVQCGSSSSYPVTVSSGGGAGVPLVGTGVG